MRVEQRRLRALIIFVMPRGDLVQDFKAAIGEDGGLVGAENNLEPLIHLGQLRRKFLIEGRQLGQVFFASFF